MASQIEHHCKCGESVWCKTFWVCRTTKSHFGEHNLPTGNGYYNTPEGYCWNCGNALGKDGIARPTMVLPEEPYRVKFYTEDCGPDKYFAIYAEVVSVLNPESYGLAPPNEERQGIWIPDKEDDDAESD